MRRLVKMGEEGFEKGIPPVFLEIFGELLVHVARGVTYADIATEKAVTARAEVIQEILDEFHADVDRLTNDADGSACAKHRRPLGERRQCSAAILGQIRRSPLPPRGRCPGQPAASGGARLVSPVSCSASSAPTTPASMGTGSARPAPASPSTAMRGWTTRPDPLEVSVGG